MPIGNRANRSSNGYSSAEVESSRHHRNLMVDAKRARDEHHAALIQTQNRQQEELEMAASGIDRFRLPIGNRANRGSNGYSSADVESSRRHRNLMVDAKRARVEHYTALIQAQSRQPEELEMAALGMDRFRQREHGLNEQMCRQERQAALNRQLKLAQDAAYLQAEKARQERQARQQQQQQQRELAHDTHNDAAACRKKHTFERLDPACFGDLAVNMAALQLHESHNHHHYQQQLAHPHPHDAMSLQQLAQEHQYRQPPELSPLWY